MLVAVYGTLKKSCCNHDILAGSEYLGSDIISGYQMYNIGAFPGAIKGPGEIFVEVYEVLDEQTENNLDILEGYPVLYDKDIVNTKFGETTLYVYNGNTRDLEIIDNGFWYEAY